jgi:hypothetical protein
MQQVLQRLQTFVTANPHRAFFEPAASAAAINDVERSIGLTLPPSYRAFLEIFNGGFINICPFGPGHKHWSIKDARWNSNHLFGTDDLVKEYNKMRSIGEWESLPYFPFCQTSGQEWLVFFPSSDGSEPPVLDAWHEASEWKPLYPDFLSLVGDRECVKFGSPAAEEPADAVDRPASR